jgi:TATA-box binding protein (TBP) (component of TFIID and TFIIIB)
MTTTIQLEGAQVGKITLLKKGLAYKNGQRAKDKKTYNQYRYSGIVFNVESDNKFCTLFDSEELYSVEFIEGTRDVESVDTDGNTVKTTVNTLEFDNCQSVNQAEKLANSEVKIKGIYKSLDALPVTESLFNSITA